jgi:hypothetical protein
VQLDYGDRQPRTRFDFLGLFRQIDDRANLTQIWRSQGPYLDAHLHRQDV